MDPGAPQPPRGSGKPVALTLRIKALTYPRKESRQGEHDAGTSFAAPAVEHVLPAAGRRRSHPGRPDVHRDHPERAPHQSGATAHFSRPPRSGSAGAGRCAGPECLPADADDAFLPETLDFFFKKISSFSVTDLNAISGINVLCLDNDSDNIVGDTYIEDGYVTNNFELKYKFNLNGEKWGCIKLALLKQYPFPEVKHSNYPEDYVWFTLSKKYRVICYNKPLRRYYTTNNGITSIQRVRNKSERKVYIRYYSWLLFHFGIRILIYSPKRFFKHILRILADTYYVYLK